MAAHGVQFESSSSIDERKEGKRQARREALEKAKQQHEKDERRKELKRQRGEDTWMLPEVNNRLQQIQEETSLKSKKKKEKKSKKKKKEKKKKAKKETVEPGDESSASSEASGEEWIEAQSQAQPTKPWQVSEQATPTEDGADPSKSAQRDQWMTFDFLAMKTTSTSERRAEKERRKEEERAKAQAIEQAGLHKLELNPYWKDGGSGLPPEDVSGTANQKVTAVVNDGGLSWLRKSYQRMKEQADREQRNLGEVVAERYGSMEEFQQRLAQAEEAARGQRGGGGGDSMARGRWKEGREDGRERWRRGRGDEPEGVPWRRCEREEECGIGRDRKSDGGQPSSSSSLNPRESQRALPPGSLKGRFLKPSDDDDSNGAPERRCHPRPPPALASSSFMKPGSDDGGDSSSPGWKKSPGRRAAPPLPPAAKDTPRRDSEDEKEEDEEEVPLLSEEEMNKLGAKLVKAEIMGNTVLVEKLRSQLELARGAREAQEARRAQQKLQDAGGPSQASPADRDVLLFTTDQAGRAWPIQAPAGPQGPRGGRRRAKLVETHVDGQRVRYFQDDDGIGLQEMVRKEKMSSAQDQTALYSRMAAKMMGRVDGEHYTLDDMFVSSAAQQEGSSREEERLRNRAVGESRRLEASMETCRHCFSSQELQKHLIVAIGSKVYLSLPAGVSLTEGHCLLCPLQHLCAATALDEDVWTEMQLFRRALVATFQAQDLDCVFMETHMNPRRRHHMVLECVPLPRHLGDMAPIYFKKAIMECDEEWAMNKKVVDLSSKDVRRAVPRGLPYFAVDFGLQGGFAHVIENEQKFPHYFGKEVVGGMMDLEPRRWRKAIRENFDDQRKKVLQFSTWWKPFDCTKSDG